MVGYSGSGKSTVARLVGEKAGCRVIEFGDVIRSEAVRQGSVEPLWRLGQSLIKDQGPLWIADQVLRQSAPGKTTIFVGARSALEVAHILRSIPALVIGIDVPVEERMRRRLRRGRSHESREGLAERDSVEAAGGIAGVLAYASVLVASSGSPDSDAREVLNKWRSLSGSAVGDFAKS
ncbi:AAA family ATPase [Frankia torreyi]|uniref:AAA family ATPase n=2 Tax=Frankia TaxID=1854 RepID=UPI003BB554EF